MLTMFLILLIVVLLVVLAVRSPSTRLQAVDNWRQLPKMASARFMAFTGLLAFLPDLVPQIQALLPQLEAIHGVPVLDRFFASDLYREIVGLVALLAIVFRAVKLSPKPDADKP